MTGREGAGEHPEDAEQGEQSARGFTVLFDPERRGLGRDLVVALRARVVDGWQEFASCAGADPEAWFSDRPGVPVPPEWCGRVHGARYAAPVSRRPCSGRWRGPGPGPPSGNQNTVQLLKAGAPIAEVITSTLDHAEGRIRRHVRHRDWFHVDPETLGLDAAQRRQESGRVEGNGQSGEAA